MKEQLFPSLIPFLETNIFMFTKKDQKKTTKNPSRCIPNVKAINDLSEIESNWKKNSIVA